MSLNRNPADDDELDAAPRECLEDLARPKRTFRSGQPGPSRGDPPVPSRWRTR
jgi:hypothetical protein